MNENLKPFLDEGLNVYAKAKDTVAQFEKEIARALSATVQLRRNWLPLKNHRVKFNKADENELSYWVSMLIEGQS